MYIDPYVLDSDPQKADIIVVTHDHFDHCSPEKIQQICTEATVIVGPSSCQSKLQGFNFRPLNVSEEIEIKGVKIKAVPAYNIGKPFHPKGSGIGVVITLDGKKIYHAGDTDFIPEMAELKDIDVALLPIGGTYTMDVEDAARAANVIKPKIVIPMHYNYLEGLEKDPREFEKLVSDEITVKIL